MDIVRRAMPNAGAIYFVSFVVLRTMTMLNLIIGTIIINGMDEAQKEVADRGLHELLMDNGDGTHEAIREQKLNKLGGQLQEITDEIKRLK